MYTFSFMLYNLYRVFHFKFDNQILGNLGVLEKNLLDKSDRISKEL